MNHIFTAVLLLCLQTSDSVSTFSHINGAKLQVGEDLLYL